MTFSLTSPSAVSFPLNFFIHPFIFSKDPQISSGNLWDSNFHSFSNLSLNSKKKKEKKRKLKSKKKEKKYNLMGQQQSKDELLYQQVSYGNTEGIKALRRDGAGLEVILKR